MEEAQRDDMIEQGAQGGDENTTSSCAGCKLPSCEIFFMLLQCPKHWKEWLQPRLHGQGGFAARGSGYRGARF